MNLFKKLIFSAILLYMVAAALAGTAALAFAFLEWRATPREQGESLQAADRVDLAPDVVPYTMFASPPDTTWHEVFMPAEEGDESPPTIELNEHRFRYGPLDETKPEGVKRIFILGGSVVFYGHANQTTIAGYLEAALRERHSSDAIEVINAGVTGYISDQELVLLVTKILDFDPDLVIVFDGFNDFLMPTAYEPRLGYPFKFETLELAWSQSRDLLRRLSQQPFHIHMLAGSHFMRRFSPHWSYVRFLRGEEMEDKDELPPPVPQAVADHLVSNWRKMAKVLSVYGIDGLFALQPYSDSVSGTYSEQYDRVEASIPAMNEEFAGDSPAIRFVSYRTVMSDKADWFYDIVHTYDKGNAYYADLLLKDMPEI